MKLLITLLYLCLLTMPLFANTSAEPEMAEALRSSGKIYVVVLVIALVFVGLGIYLFRLDRKVSKLEKESQSDKS
jgi:CcmD family protein